MERQVNLLEILDTFDNSKPKISSFDDLKHVIRHNIENHSADRLTDAGYQRIFERLFKTASAAQKDHQSKSHTSNTTKGRSSNATTDYLIKASSTLRYVIDVSVTTLKSRTVKFVLQHICDYLSPGQESSCKAFELDCAKALSSLLAYGPHVEHLLEEEWLEAISVCLAGVQKTQDSDEDETLTSSRRNGQTDRWLATSRRSKHNQVSPLSRELVTSLKHLTSATNARLPKIAIKVYRATIQFLKSDEIVKSTHEDAFLTISNIVNWAVTENLRLVKSMLGDVLTVIRKFWNTRQNNLREVMVGLLVQLQPCLSSCVELEINTNLREELKGLYDIILQHASTIAERDLLTLNDVDVLPLEAQDRLENMVVNGCLSLRMPQPRAEQQWAILSLLADWTLSLTTTRAAATHAEDQPDDMPRKRMRTTHEIEELVAAARSLSTSSSVIALQTIAIMMERSQDIKAFRAAVLKMLAEQCIDSRGNVASWAFIAAANLIVSGDEDTEDLEPLTTLWRVAVRCMSADDTCRASCHFLAVSMHRQRVPEQMCADLTQQLASSLDLTGPSILTDTAMHLLEYSIARSRMILPAVADQLTQRASSWFARKWTPSKLDNHSIKEKTVTITLAGLLGFISCILGTRIPTAAQAPFAECAMVGETILRGCQQQQLSDYLLLRTRDDKQHHLSTSSRELHTSQGLSRATSISTKATLLGHMLEELPRLTDAFKLAFADRAVNLTPETCNVYITAAIMGVIASHGLNLGDSRSVDALRQRSIDLLGAIEAGACQHDCKKSTIDCILRVSMPLLYHNDVNGRGILHTQRQDVTIIANMVDRVMSSRNRHDATFSQEQKSASAPLAERISSQELSESAYTPMASQGTQAALHSTASMRMCLWLFAYILTALDNRPLDDMSNIELSRSICDHITALPANIMPLALFSLVKILNHDLSLSRNDAQNIMEVCSNQVLGSYTFNRSELALCATMAFMTATVSQWADTSNDALSKLGLDVYDWLSKVALTSDVLSSYTQQHCCDVLLAICKHDPDYGSQMADSSARTSLFQLLRKAPARVLFHLAPRLPSLFSLYSLSLHNDMFVDVQESLPVDITWPEGIALRLYILAEMGSTWHSLLRHCVYYIFETAGQVSSAVGYATRCLDKLRSSLGLTSMTQLFDLFCPQLLYTWLDGHAIQDLPYQVFGFATFKDFLLRNKDEIVAQLFLRQLQPDLDLISAELGLSMDTLLTQAFDRVFAYAMSWDITNVTSNKNNDSCESRLRSELGSKERFKQLIRRNNGTIIGRVLLATNREELDERWLEKRDAYQHASTALSEMKDYSASGATLPPSQQPHFKSKYLLDQLERLGRRLGHTSTAELWNSASYVLATQMLFDNMDDALGPMHHSAILQKQRLMISLAHKIPLQGFALESTVRFILPFIDDEQCADDAIGILHYLLQKSLTHLLDRPSFLWSISITLLLRLSRCEVQSQQSASQTSQQRDTLSRMRKFRTWLLAYLQNALSALTPARQEIATAAIDALQSCSLPGNCAVDTSESKFLLLLLKPEAGLEDLLGLVDRDQIILLLTRQFELPSSSQDCLQAEQDVLVYAKSLWRAAQICGVHNNFVLWAALVAGRAFAISGRHDLFETIKATHTPAPAGAEQDGSLAASRGLIIDHLSNLAQSNNSEEVSIAMSTIRSCMQSLNNQTATDYEGLLSDDLAQALGDDPSIYRKPSTLLAGPLVANASDQLRQAWSRGVEIDTQDWTQQVALAVCMISGKHSFIRGLPLLLSERPGSAVELLPSLLHQVLSEHITDPHLAKDIISSKLREHLQHGGIDWQDRQRALLEILLHLLRQEYPNESTHLDRMKWLNCDYMAAAESATRCGLSTTALMLAELARSSVTGTRRSGSRTSLSKDSMVIIPNDLLITVFEHVEEPDSYYGVAKTASLQSFLDRAKYEGNALQALTAASAKVGSIMAAQPSSQQYEDHSVLKSLSALNLDSLAFALAQNNSDMANAGDTLFDNAQALRQWHLSIPDSHTSTPLLAYRTFQALNQAADRPSYVNVLHDIVRSQVKLCSMTAAQRPSWMSATAIMAEVLDAVSHSSFFEQHERCDINASRNAWMSTTDLDGVLYLARGRATLAGVLTQNKSMLEKLQLPRSTAQQYEMRALIMLSQLARSQTHKELAQSTSWLLQELVDNEKHIDSDLIVVAKKEIASVLWSVGDSSGSVDMLQQLITTNSASIDMHPTQAGLLSQLGQQLADARLEKPSDILRKYLQPSIEQLQQQRGAEAGQVYYTFASFCDAQLQNADAIADFQRLTKLRQAKLEEVEHLKASVAALKKADADRKFHSRALDRAKQWFDLDNEEYQRVKRNQDVFAEQALQNYMLTLRATDKHDFCILRLFALWLEHGETKQVQTMMTKTLGSVPTWKFVVLMNQLMSRLKGNKSDLDKILLSLLLTICRDHPYHTVHHLYAARKFPGKDDASAARRDAADRLAVDLGKIKGKGETILRMLKADSLYRTLAEEPSDKHNGKHPLKDSPAATRIHKHLPKEKIPPATVELALQPDGVYKDVPAITKISGTMTVMSGLSAPKLLVMTASDGKQYKLLFKGGNDDLRQDAIMEQVFSEVSKMLRNHKASRRRDLQVRTYKVIPLTNRCGIIEFVPNSLPINEFLQPAHLKYHPTSMKASEARQKIAAVADQSRETRVKEFRKVCEQMPPVMRHFFFERFKDPDEWFRNRTAYTRTTATISMLGQVLGLGDRHCHNILLDEHNGEVIHIDLGVAFEAGRVLPIPELVPFRLTRDIVDGMGVTGTEGIFKRCAEFTLEALRKDKNAIMTLLNVLRYDPLYSWTLSPVRAKRMQQQQMSEMVEKNGESKAMPAGPGTNSIDEAGEAERALSIVEKKLGNALSTAASVSEMIQVATDERNLATLFNGWAAFF